jgi:hypothetical protein
MAKERDLYTWECKLHSEGVDEKSTEQRHAHPGEEILHADVFVISRKDVLLSEAHLMVMIIVMVRVVLDCFHDVPRRVPFR